MNRFDTSATYVYGNTVRKVGYVDPRWDVQEPSRESVKKNHKATRMTAGYVFFLIVAIMVAAVILINYIQMQAQLSGLSTTVTRMERELNELKDANNDAYSRIMNGIDMEEIRRVAIEEFGMVYAQEDQIVLYESANNDYMRQVSKGNH